MFRGKFKFLKQVSVHNWFEMMQIADAEHFLPGKNKNGLRLHCNFYSCHLT